MTHDQATELVQTLFLMYPRARATQETIAVYAASLTRYDAGPLSRACTALSEESEYIPSLASIHKRVQELSDRRPGGVYDRAMATPADRSCRVCAGSGWILDVVVVRGDRRYSAVRACACRGGDPVDIRGVDRDALGDDVLAALTEFEMARGEILLEPGLRMVAGRPPAEAVKMLSVAAGVFVPCRTRQEVFEKAIGRVNA